MPGCEQVRLASSGTEAAMSAVRLARGATGRDRVIKFDGCCSGTPTACCARGGSGVAMLGLLAAVGVTAGAWRTRRSFPDVVPADQRWPA